MQVSSLNAKTSCVSLFLVQFPSVSSLIFDKFPCVARYWFGVLINWNRTNHWFSRLLTDSFVRFSWASFRLTGQSRHDGNLYIGIYTALTMNLGGICPPYFSLFHDSNKSAVNCFVKSTFSNIHFSNSSEHFPLFGLRNIWRHGDIFLTKSFKSPFQKFNLILCSFQPPLNCDTLLPSFLYFPSLSSVFRHSLAHFVVLPKYPFGSPWFFIE